MCKSELSSVPVLEFCSLPSAGYYLKVVFNGVLMYIPLDSEFNLFHPDWVSFETVHGFVPRSPSISYKFYSSGLIFFDLPTCCGYLSSKNNWLKTGRFHRLCFLNIGGFCRF